MLVRFRNVALAQDEAGCGRNSQSERLIEQAAKNEQVEFLGRRVDGRDRLTVSVGKISRMTCLIERSRKRSLERTCRVVHRRGGRCIPAQTGRHAERDEEIERANSLQSRPACPYLEVASGSIPLFPIASEARAEERNSISRLEPSISPGPATTAAENVWTN